MRVLISGDQSTSRDQCRRAALRVGLECASPDCVPLNDLRLRLSREPAVHFVLVCIEPSPEESLRSIKAATTQAEVPVYAVTLGEVATYREQAIAAGASDVWPLDGVREGLLSTAEQVRQEGRSTGKRGRVVLVTAALPGTGVTTVATGLAFGMAGKTPIALTELGDQVPDLALNLDLTPRHSLGDLLRESDRMDVSMIRDTAVSHPAGVDILAYAPETLQTEPLTPVMLRDLQILLRTLYNWTIVDGGHAGGENLEQVARHADLVVLVTRLDPPSVRLTRRYAQDLLTKGVTTERIALVGNRYGQAGQIPWKKAQEALQTTVAGWLSDDPRAVNRSLTEGRPLVQVARRARVTRELYRLATELKDRLGTVR